MVVLLQRSCEAIGSKRVKRVYSKTLMIVCNGDVEVGCRLRAAQMVGEPEGGKGRSALWPQRKRSIVVHDCIVPLPKLSAAVPKDEECWFPRGHQLRREITAELETTLQKLHQ